MLIISVSSSGKRTIRSVATSPMYSAAGRGVVTAKASWSQGSYPPAVTKPRSLGPFDAQGAHCTTIRGDSSHRVGGKPILCGGPAPSSSSTPTSTAPPPAAAPPSAPPGAAFGDSGATSFPSFHNGPYFGLRPRGRHRIGTWRTRAERAQRDECNPGYSTCMPISLVAHLLLLDPLVQIGPPPLEVDEDLFQPHLEVIRAIMLDGSPCVLHEQSTHRLPLDLDDQRRVPAINHNPR